MKHALAAAAVVVLCSGGVAGAQTPAPHGNTVNVPHDVVTSTGVGTGKLTPPPIGAAAAPPSVMRPPDAEPRQAQVPMAGANSFTEEQARARITDDGFSNVGALHKDDQGVWQGSAMKGGQSFQVGLDYQGNIVSR